MPLQEMLPGFEAEQSATPHKVAEMSLGLTKPEVKKALGAFYTPPAMAAALIDWAVRSPEDRVFDPSFGGYVFLEAASRRLRSLGADLTGDRPHLFGVELDQEAFQAAPRDEQAALLHGDFFDMRPEKQIPLVEAVAGNPPYIRYQDFNRSAEAAHRIAVEAGVPLTRLASSWAPFLVHAISFVAEGGRMAQVLPAELIHAQYANGITRYLAANFDRVSIAVFDERVFPGALEEIVLLFAEGRSREAEGSVSLVSFDSFAAFDPSALFPSTGPSRHCAAPGKLLSQLLPESTRSLLCELSEKSETEQLGDLAAVEIGAVTGANDFFLLSSSEAKGMPSEIVRPAVSKAAQIAGATLVTEEHSRLLAEGRKGLMFVADSGTATKNEAVRRHIAAGEEMGVPAAYKCRIREDWWSVPVPRRGVADLLLTYFASEHPRLVLNEARVLQTNTIHGVYLTTQVDAAALAVAFYNSLTLLSAELVGRSYGGGVLKLEPTEAATLILPPIPADLGDLLGEVDALVRARKLEAVLDLVDPIVLGEGLGLSRSEIHELRKGGLRLRTRRRSRAVRPAPARN
jgi:adenine-specific DNA-methyltransferase